MKTYRVRIVTDFGEVTIFVSASSSMSVFNNLKKKIPTLKQIKHCEKISSEKDIISLKEFE